MPKRVSTKQIKIDKASTTIVIVTSVSAFVIIFSLIASKSLYSQLGYQNRIATARQAALNQLKTDVSAKTQLVNAYEKFVSPSKNIIGGSSTGTGANDGNNAQIILDALPSQYNFPALASSLQAMLGRQTVNIDSISGTDKQLTQPSSSTGGAIAPVAIPISFSADGAYQSVENVISDFQNSIQPFQIQSLQLSGNQSDITLSVTAQTFYQPQKNFVISSEIIQ